MTPVAVLLEILPAAVLLAGWLSILLLLGWYLGHLIDLHNRLLRQAEHEPENAQPPPLSHSGIDWPPPWLMVIPVFLVVFLASPLIFSVSLWAIYWSFRIKPTDDATAAGPRVSNVVWSTALVLVGMLGAVLASFVNNFLLAPALLLVLTGPFIRHFQRADD
jgi:hypothetical protein